MNKEHYSPVFMILAITMAACCMAANTISARLGVFPWGIAPMGVFSFPLIYVISDIIGDVYGYGQSRKLAWTTIASNFLFILLILGPSKLVAPLNSEMDAAIWMIFTPAIMVLIGGTCGMVAGGWVNDIVFQIFRHKDGYHQFLKRKVLSTLAAEATDTCVFITIAFGLGMGMWSLLPMMILIQFLMKVTVEMLLAAPTKWIINIVRKHEIADAGREVYQDRNDYSFFGFRSN